MAVRWLGDPTTFLSIVQVRTTLVGILAGASGGATLGAHLARAEHGGVPATIADTLGIGSVAMVITRPLLVVGEFVPKRPALVDPEGIASRITAPMALVARLGSLLVWLLRGSTDAGLRLLGIGDT